MVGLANALGTDAWFTVPWNADEDYVRRFATYVRDNLAPGRKAYVEVANEVWNWGFRVISQARDEGRAEGLSNNTTEPSLRRAEEETSELHSQMRNSSAVYCLTQKTYTTHIN